MMKLVAGLGNPSPKHDRTRHNVGFDVLNRLARRFAPGAIARSKFSSVTIDAQINDEKVLLLKPTTYMNLSGQAVAEAVRFYKINPEEDLLVVVDDVALSCGTIRLRTEGSAGGHNGLADIEQKLATSAYSRLRIGIDSPGQIPQKNYVLGRFRPDQIERLEPALDEAADAVTDWVRLGITETMNRYNRKNTA